MKGRTLSSLLKFLPVLVSVAVTAGLACSSSGTSGNDAGAAACVDSLCAAGNKCIDNGKGEIKCRLTCKEHYGAEGCRSAQYCKWSTTPSGVSYCADVDGAKVAAKPGQWGFSCNPTGGEDNDGCDAAQKFKCFADSPTDVNSALCTTFGCKVDTECPGQFYCATVNTAPNATTADRSFGETRTVCLPRTQCAPCARDADCKGGRCVADGTGVNSCMATCDRDTACPKDAGCIEGKSDVPVCYPYADVCKGDGKLCSPCRSDADCTAGGGVCYDALPNSTERFCTQKVENCSKDTCPKPASGAAVACFKPETAGVGGQCTGLVKLLTEGELPACWSKKR